MFTHVMVGSKDPEKSRSFYDKVLGALGIGPSQAAPNADRHFYGEFGKGVFAVGKPRHGDQFHAEALANGGSCEGPPGPRQGPVGEIYGAYVRDPDGNKLASFARPGS